MLFDTLSSSIEHIRGGQAACDRGDQRASAIDALPDVPIMADTVPGYEVTAWFGVGVPKGTPSAIVEKLNREINAALADPKIKARFAELGAVPFVGDAGADGDARRGGDRNGGARR